jgi:chitin-binding protein
MPDLQLPGGSAPTHGGIKHLTTVTVHGVPVYRIDSHNAPGAIDHDRVTQTGPTRTDRLRCEVRGMVGPEGQLDLLDGQTWRLVWSFFIPASLKGTRRFTHIFQLKFVDTKGGASGSPIITLTLRPNDTMELLFWLGGGTIATTSIAGLHDKWLTSDLTMKLAGGGSVHWVLSDGTKTLVDKQQSGVTWPSDAARARPKWGIYRGLTDGVVSTYLLLSGMRAYQCP